MVAPEDRTRWFMREILPHEPALRSWLGRKRALNIDVDDIVQEAYSVLAARETVDDIAFPRAYLFQVAHSLVVRDIRRARIVPFQALDDLGTPETAQSETSPEQNVVARDELRRLGLLIATLPGKTREAFVMRRVHGLPQREIARCMRISESTVEKHITRGLRALMDQFAHGGKEAPQTSNTHKGEQTPDHEPARQQPIHR